MASLNLHAIGKLTLGLGVGLWFLIHVKQSFEMEIILSSSDLSSTFAFLISLMSFSGVGCANCLWSFKAMSLEFLGPVVMFKNISFSEFSHKLIGKAKWPDFVIVSLMGSPL